MELSNTKVLSNNFEFYTMELDYTFTCTLIDNITNESISSIFVVEPFENFDDCEEWLIQTMQFYKNERIQRYKRITELYLYLQR